MIKLLKQTPTPDVFSENPFTGELADEDFSKILTEKICSTVINKNSIIAITDTKGVIKYANDAFVKLSQYSRAELIGNNHRILNSGVHPPEFFKRMYQAISEGQFWRRDICNRAKDGSLYWVDTTIVQICNRYKKPIGYVAVRVDITAHKVAEEARQLSEERFHDLAECGSDWFWEMDSSFRFTEISASIRQQVGLDPGLFISKRLWELPLEGEGISMIAHKKNLEDHRPFKGKIFKISFGKAVSGIWISLSGRPKFDFNNRFIGFRGVGRSVTNRLLTQTKNREQSNMLQAIKQSFPGGFTMINHKMEIIESNPQFKNLLGLPDSLFKGPYVGLDKIIRFCTIRGDFGPGNVDELVAKNLNLQSKKNRNVYEHRLQNDTVLEIRSAPLKSGGWVRTYVDITERKRLDLKIKYMADHDALTGLPNRLVLRQNLKEALARASRKKGSFSLLLIDLDHFKDVNDMFGHPTGDALLVQVAERLSQSVRTGDVVARIGGDEFAVLLSEVRTAGVANDFAQRLIEIISEPYFIENRRLLIGASIGGSIAPSHGNNADELFKNADIALYQAKSNGRGIFWSFDAELNVQNSKRIALERDLREALNGNQFDVYFQPQIDLTNNVIVGFEALVRWNHPTRGIVSPLDFISVAEDIGLINSLGEWVLRVACKTAAVWPAHIKVAVNVSPIQLKDPFFLNRVDSCLEQSGLPACRLEIEITENVILQLDSKIIAVLTALRTRGITLAMDDFGTGYSSLTSLLKFQFDKIKIDRSFLNRLPDCDRSLALLRSIVLLGKGLGMATVAEGIESRQQLELVQEEGCSEAQGYLIGRPGPISDHANFLNKEPISLLGAGLRVIARSA